jgi:sigma-E factor negative regulatory protein RseC
MEQLVRVRQTYDNGTAQVILVRESACSGDCHKCSGCGAAKETLLILAENPIGASAGELVRLRSETAPVMKAALVLYILPLVLFFAGYFLGAALLELGTLIGCLAFAAGIGGAVAYDRLVAAKKKPVYTIFGYADEATPEAWRKGDNEFD